MRVFKVKVFMRFQRKEAVRDSLLRQAVHDMELGLIDADLGQGLIKQRVARPGQGKSGSYRTIIAYRRGNRAVFLYGFAKNAKAALKPDELEDLIKIEKSWLGAEEEEIETAIVEERLKELEYDKESEDHE